MAWGWMKRKNQSYLALAVGGRSGSGKINSTARDDIVIIKYDEGRFYNDLQVGVEHLFTLNQQFLTSTPTQATPGGVSCPLKGMGSMQ